MRKVTGPTVKIEYEKESSQKPSELSQKYPKNFFDIMEGIKKMRLETEAPVDTMGCDKLHDEQSSENEKAYQTLVNLILSA